MKIVTTQSQPGMQPTKTLKPGQDTHLASAHEAQAADSFEKSVGSNIPGMIGRGLAVAALGAVPLMGTTAHAGFVNKHVPSLDYKPGSIGGALGWLGTGANVTGSFLLAGAAFSGSSVTPAAVALATSSVIAVYNDVANSNYRFIREG